METQQSARGARVLTPTPITALCTPPQAAAKLRARAHIKRESGARSTREKHRRRRKARHTLGTDRSVTHPALSATNQASTGYKRAEEHASAVTQPSVRRHFNKPRTSTQTQRGRDSRLSSHKKAVTPITARNRKRLDSCHEREQRPMAARRAAEQRPAHAYRPSARRAAKIDCTLESICA